MKSKEIKILENQDFFTYDDHFDELDPTEYANLQVDWITSESGLVDWSVEIPKSIKRLRKIEQILSSENSDFRNRLENYWPK